MRVIAGDHAMSHLDGLLPAEGGRILATRLRAMSFDVCGHDPRTHAQRRADALVALAAGHTHLECRCGSVDCTARTDTTAKNRAGVQVQVLVGVDASTLLGLDDAPGYLSGHGAIDADLARELAADATWKQVLTLSAADRARLTGDSNTGPVLGIGPTLPSPNNLHNRSLPERENDCGQQPIVRAPNWRTSSGHGTACAASRTAPRPPPHATSTTRSRSIMRTRIAAGSPSSRISRACAGPTTGSRPSATGPSAKSGKAGSSGSIPPVGPA